MGRDRRRKLNQKLRALEAELVKRALLAYCCRGGSRAAEYLEREHETACEVTLIRAELLLANAPRRIRDLYLKARKP